MRVPQRSVTQHMVMKGGFTIWVQGMTDRGRCHEESWLTVEYL